MGLLSIYGRRILWAASTGSVLFGRGKEIHLKLVGLYIGFRNPISVFTLLLSVESSLSNQQPLSPTILLKQLAYSCSMAFSDSWCVLLSYSYAIELDINQSPRVLLYTHEYTANVFMCSASGPQSTLITCRY